jgi:NAD-dependent deacetylase
MGTAVPDEECRRRIREAAGLIKNARYLTAFTGAGISAESGLPLFRGPDGLWSKLDPDLFEIGTLAENPERVWPMLKGLYSGLFDSIEPNDAHRVLARLEERKILKVLVTQNVDSLHQKAGSRNVVEYHGNARTLVCLACGKASEVDDELLRAEIPRCRCGGILKPNVIFFGEGIPVRAAQEAERAARKTDVMLVVGSTGVVYPAAMIPRVAASRGAKIVEVNPSESEFTQQISNIFIPLPAAKGLSMLAGEIFPSADDRADS